MKLFQRKKQENRADEVFYEDPVLQSLFGTSTVSRNTASQVPTIASAINIISSIVASTPIKLYEEDGEETKEVKGDKRIALLNDETGDTLNANEFWKAIIADYYFDGNGYAYINKKKGEYASLHYVESVKVSVQNNTDAIFKDYDILVDGNTYKPFDFFKILRNTKDGSTGVGIVSQNSKAIEVAYEGLVFEGNLVKKGGNKKGFLKSASKLNETALANLKSAFASLYSNNTGENAIILNDGMDFKESSSTSVEMQLNENKESNAKELCKLLNVSPDVISGKATAADIESLAKLAVIPLMKVIESALNKDLLRENEKGAFYFAFDTKELLKGSMLDRYKAYEIAVRNGFKTRSEVRYIEDDPKIEGLDIVSMNLADVIFDPKTQTYFTPNTKEVTDPKNTSKGGEE